jgi:DNA-binding transcriptional MerR regulator
MNDFVQDGEEGSLQIYFKVFTTAKAKWMSFIQGLKSGDVPLKEARDILYQHGNESLLANACEAISLKWLGRVEPWVHERAEQIRVYPKLEAISMAIETVMQFHDEFGCDGHETDEEFVHWTEFSRDQQYFDDLSCNVWTKDMLSEALVLYEMRDTDYECFKSIKRCLPLEASESLILFLSSAQIIQDFNGFRTAVSNLANTKREQLTIALLDTAFTALESLLLYRKSILGEEGISPLPFRYYITRGLAELKSKFADNRIEGHRQSLAEILLHCQSEIKLIQSLLDSRDIKSSARKQLSLLTQSG